MSASAFTAYDVRGQVGVNFDAALVERIARAFAQVLNAKRVVIGQDNRLTSPEFADAVARGLMASGVEVLDIGLAGTEEVYFATSHLMADGGIMVTASHNPMNYNGLKLVGAGSVPLSRSQFKAIQTLAQHGDFKDLAGGRCRSCRDVRADYVTRVLSFVDPLALPAVTVLVNAGNGAAGPTFDAIAERLQAAGAPVRFERLNHQPDGHFPNGVPNPLLSENQPVTAAAVRAAKADLGVAFDGDFDRCFLFDGTGAFVPGEYVVGLLAEAFLAKEPGAAIVHDPRVIWNTQSLVARSGGRAVMARTGHAYLKAALRQSGAIYGGEMSAHHYFRDFMACDSGMIPWLLVVELIGRSGRSLAELLAEMRANYPSSGEINFRVTDAAAAMARVETALVAAAVSRDDTDGMSLDFGRWRLNLRRSNTEALLRLNVEARGDASLVAEAVQRVSALIDDQPDPKITSGR